MASMETKKQNKRTHLGLIDRKAHFVRLAHGLVVLERERHDVRRVKRLDVLAQRNEFMNAVHQIVGDVRLVATHVGLRNVIDESHQRAVHQHAHHTVIVVGGKLGLQNARRGAQRDAERAEHAEPRKHRVERGVEFKIDIAHLRVVDFAHRFAKRRAFGHLAGLVDETRQRCVGRHAGAERARRDGEILLISAEQIHCALERVARQLLRAHFETHRQQEEIGEHQRQLLLERASVDLLDAQHVTRRNEIQQVRID